MTAKIGTGGTRGDRLVGISLFGAAISGIDFYICSGGEGGVGVQNGRIKNIFCFSFLIYLMFYPVVPLKYFSVLLNVLN